MAKTIMLQTKKECFFCGSTINLHLHHCIYGRGRRWVSDEEGLTVYLCQHHHTGTPYGVHRNKEMDLMLKKEAQKAFEKQHSHEEYMERFGRNYLE